MQSMVTGKQQEARGREGKRAAPPAALLLRIVCGLGCLVLAVACRPVSFSPEPTNTPQPEVPAVYRASLQSWAQLDPDLPFLLPRYEIRAELDQSGEHLSGHMLVHVPNSATTEWNDLVFRLYPNVPQYAGEMNIQSAEVEDQAAGVELVEQGTAVRLALPEPLLPGEVVDVALDFDVFLPSNTGDYTLFGWNGDVLSLPGFYPALAVYQEGIGQTQGHWLADVGPLFADVSFSALAWYELEFVAPASLTLVSSGSTLETGDIGSGRQLWRVAGGPLRDMTVFAGDGWGALSDTAAGATVTSYFPAGQNAAGKAALLHAAAALRLYADLYGPYPYTEFDVVSVPLGYRGMEYSGVVTIGQDLYATYRDQLAFLVAHETAHQWWYVQVGSDPLSYPWLDEGLAEYAVYDYYRAVYGTEPAGTLRDQRWRLPVESDTNRALVAGSVDRPAQSMDQANYQLLAYAKPALFFDALRGELGDEIYQEVLRQYVETYRWRIATPQDFLGTAQNVSGANLNPLAESWLR